VTATGAAEALGVTATGTTLGSETCSSCALGCSTNDVGATTGAGNEGGGISTAGGADTSGSTTSGASITGSWAAIATGGTAACFIDKAKRYGKERRGLSDNEDALIDHSIRCITHLYRFLNGLCFDRLNRDRLFLK